MAMTGQNQLKSKGAVSASSKASHTAQSPEKPRAGGRKPNPVDIHVGSRVRLRRMVLGMSQERLGEQMDLTFQQIQKYEKGTNRIGASRLFRLAEILNVPVNFFFEGLDVAGSYGSPRSAQSGFAEPNTEGFVLDFLDSREGVELNRAFVQIKDPKVRKSIVEMVRTFANTQDRES